jgi:uncharacterized protein (UPF0332 family)
MSSKRFDWTVWFSDKTELDNSFNFYLKKGLIREEKETINLSKSHINKTNYNLDFINFLEENNVFSDWEIVGCYYAIYHAALALLVKKGFSSKNHLATLCCLIKLYYSDKDNDTLTKEEIELVSKSSLEKEEVTYFTQAKDKRETASYGVESSFNNVEAKDLKLKTIAFVNKSKIILEQ